ncbi:MAG: FAD-binding protein [Coriobacteriaceae bacterium]|jgi:3-oxo-5alpha-steroid 4-dehydrogenase|nr:FAD-binding protein [Coriobacteriaceae bacterium]
MEGTREFSRRDFLKRSAAVGAGLAAAGALASCAAPQGSSGNAAPDGTAKTDVVWDKEADVVVVGFGGAGGAAAIEAASAGAQVTIVEITKEGGGSTTINGGFLMLGGTQLQKDLGINDTADEFAKYLVAAAGPSGNAEAWQFMAKGSPALYDWCVDVVGMTFDKVVDEGKVGAGRPGLGLAYSGNERSRKFSALAKPAPRGHIPSPEGSGVGFFRPLKAKVEELGCEVLYETTAEHLIQDSAGRVIGISATGADKKTLNIKAKRGVCLTAGGFGMNAEMMQANFIFDERPAYPTACPTELGIGIQMGLEIGADTYGMSQHAMGRALYSAAGDDPLKGIIVDPNGRRIVAEDEYYAFVGRAIIYNHGAFLIVDDQVNKDITTLGEPVASAATIEVLADALKMPPAILSATLGFYNQDVAAGEDSEFGKHDEFLVPLTTAPYHAYDVGASGCYYHTLGGLRIDLEARVQDLAGKPIPGLFAAGRNSNIAYGYYVGSGSSMFDVFTFGRIAGQNAAAESPVA